MKKLAVLGIIAGLLIVCFVSFTGAKESKKSGKSVVWSGYLADKLCATTANGISADGANMKTNPENHTVACLLQDPCVKSGYGIMLKGKDGTYSFVKFDKQGDEKALALAKSTKRQNGMYVEVSGKKSKKSIIVSSIVEKEMQPQ